MPALAKDVLFGPTSKFSKPDAFHTLVEDLSKMLGPTSGIDSADVDPKELQSLMEEYVSNPSEWQKYALGDPSRPYTRNLVDKGNGKSNLVLTHLDRFVLLEALTNLQQLILVWTPGKGSPIHE